MTTRTTELSETTHSIPESQDRDAADTTTTLVVVWSKKEGVCVQCNAAVRQLNKAQVPHAVVYLEDAPTEQIDEFRRQGFASAPIIVTSANTLYGYRPDAINDLIEQWNTGELTPITVPEF